MRGSVRGLGLGFRIIAATPEGLEGRAMSMCLARAPDLVPESPVIGLRV